MPRPKPVYNPTVTRRVRARPPRDPAPRLQRAWVLKQFAPEGTKLCYLGQHYVAETDGRHPLACKGCRDARRRP